jgi:ribosomal protein L11 methyltransferase
MHSNLIIYIDDMTYNPFQQNPVTYCLSLQIKFRYLQDFVQFCENLSDSIVYFEAEDTKSIDNKPEDLWQIDVYLDKKPNLDELNQQFNNIAVESGTNSPELLLSQIDDKDWVSEVQKTFVPIEAGKFFIHHSGYEGKKPTGFLEIEVNAGRAFGTGEHETTSNCLKALSELKDLGNCLDMGCGSGILAIAMNKLGGLVTAVDLDEQAVQVTNENKQLNKVEFRATSQSNGYEDKIVAQNSPYQTITANILAGPLIAMAEDASDHLASQGNLILAGFLKDQLLNVLEAHKKQGLTLVKEICVDNWPVLVMTKPNDK